MVGEFKYCDELTDAIVIYKANSFTEEYELDKGPVKIDSKIKWLSDNSYRVTAKKVNGICPFKKGDTFVVTILTVRDNTVVYKYNFPDGSEGTECFEKVSVN
jgi:hypothetical protein